MNLCKYIPCVLFNTLGPKLGIITAFSVVIFLALNVTSVKQMIMVCMIEDKVETERVDDDEYECETKSYQNFECKEDD